MAERHFPSLRDARGELMVVEGADLDFPIRRVFTVTGSDGAGPRGGHRATCTELLVLVTGSATVTLRPPGSSETVHVLETTGAAVRISTDTHVAYQLGGGDSVVVVLCDEPYRSLG